MKQFLKSLFYPSPQYNVHYFPVMGDKLYGIVNGKKELIYQKDGDTSRIKFLHNELIKSCAYWGIKSPKPLPDFNLKTQ
jgi:hypothetical protein